MKKTLFSKIACLFLVVVLLVFAACGKTDPKDDEDPSQPQPPLTSFDYERDTTDLGYGSKDASAVDLSERETYELLSARLVDWKSTDAKTSVYDEASEDTPFYTDSPDMATYAANEMWKFFGTATDSSDLYQPNPSVEGYNPDGKTGVMPFGTEPAFYEWVAQISMWTENESKKQTLKNFVLDRPIMADGYIWSWNDSPHWPSITATESWHIDNMPRYISAVYQIVCWENSTDFLFQKDTSTVQITDPAQKEHEADDVSNGLTVKQKCDMAMNYMLEVLDGKSGLLCIKETEDQPYLKNMHGGLDAASSNYWDNLPFGYYDAYENMLFYNALYDMAGIEILCGNFDKAKEYADLAVQVRSRYNETFWADDTLRYIGTIDSEGIRRDYGFTFLNTESIYYGLTGETQAKNILSWLKGNRIVAGDDTQGADIYKSAVRFNEDKSTVWCEYGVAPVANTYDYERTRSAEQHLVTVINADGTSTQKEDWLYWWNGNHNGNTPYQAGQYTYHLENGGAIFYTSYYDIMARLRTAGADDALNRFTGIAYEFATDYLGRDPLNPYWNVSWVIGITGEFAESALVPLVYLNGFAGVTATHRGLEIAPSIPSAYEKVGVKQIVYGGNRYGVEVYPDGKVLLTAFEAVDLKLRVRDYAGKGTATVSVKDGDYAICEQTVAAENGYFVFDLSKVYEGGATIEIA